ncbi:GPI ethanolamine phosphate transferase 1 [Hondaea fermentalgiana]|uniref:GPI ethanolamine phosphate transferase 1 n=1 Tax=Hondaea fermentalgiana TaxID=2315210 RepID=A0A2R5GE24_9STRA|nr:GPI ethanolamine phosphate transferase 1 [Hondaea fermentalgiana]|eukprot:GBG29190.1 GPI ethanolamine phosphate transferase 1 [Hondaea fermentalgiana]
MGRNTLLAVCFVFHVCYFFSIFDIYFRSPIDPDLEAVAVHEASRAPAKRLVLFVADGLRADTCFRFLGRDVRYHDPDRARGRADRREANYEADATIWPAAKTSFLREMIENQGRWGISHTRVPTESRPGHVAVIAGFYEDVSAVTRGWQDNPVDFDHVFNQSRRTWLWGSPDITRMFAKRHEHVTDWFYSPAEEDFAAKDLTMLDTWVFNKASELLKETETNATLRAMVHEDRVVFFLHLLGLDSNGHAHRPHAPEYYQNMASVDKGVRGIHALFESYFHDNATAYVFTSDHGMGNQGAHGDGHPTNTRTPLVAWGSGIRGPTHLSDLQKDPRAGISTGFTAQAESEFSSDWGLAHLERTDVEQADLAPLLASLIGVPVPVNSVGRLPADFLEPGKYTAEALVRNARQLLAQVEYKEAARRARHIRFRPYGPTDEARRALQNADILIKKGDTEQAEAACRASMRVSIEALRYYQVYDRFYLGSVIVAGYLGWILLLAAELTIPGDSPQGRADPAWTPLSVLVCIFSVLLFATQVIEESPLMYHAYLIFPAVFWTLVLRRKAVWTLWWNRVCSHPKAAVMLFVYVAGTQIIVVGYTYRNIYVVLFLALACWPCTVPALWDAEIIRYESHTGQLKAREGRKLRLSWALSCLLLGSCTLIPLDLNDQPFLLFAGGLLMLGLMCTLFSGDLDKFTTQRKLQLALIALGTALPLATDASLRAKTGLPLVNQVLTWISFLVSPVLSRFSSRTPYKRYLSIFAGLATPYCLLSVNFEVLFYVALGFTLMQWLVLERATFYAHKTSSAGAGTSSRRHLGRGQDSQEAAVSIDDVRSAFMFLCFVHIAFFGTGNIASMSSFQISSSFRFTTVFSPFLMGGLLVIKLLVPYTLVTSLVAIVSAERRAAGVSAVSPHRLFFLVLTLCDLLAVHLFFWVRDEGSWLEIGNSISQYGFVNCQLIFIPLLFALASFFLSGVSMTLPSAAKSS